LDLVPETLFIKIILYRYLEDVLSNTKHVMLLKVFSCEMLYCNLEPYVGMFKQLY